MQYNCCKQLLPVLYKGLVTTRYTKSTVPRVTVKPCVLSEVWNMKGFYSK